MLPVLQDVDTFTERFIEPTFCFYLALKCFAYGQTAMGWWLIFSVMALNMYTGLRHQAERGRLLDWQDIRLEATFYQRFMAGLPTRNMAPMERIVKKTAAAVEEEPSMLTVIEEQNPDLAKAIERFNARRKSKEQPNTDTEVISQAA
jgi:hypothetical protein